MNVERVSKHLSVASDEYRAMRVNPVTVVLLICLACLPLPTLAKDAYQTLCDYGSFEVFCTLVAESGLEHTIRGSKAITVFAPSDRVFDSDFSDELEMLRAPHNRPRLRQWVLSHFVSQKIRGADLQREPAYASMSGSEIQVVLMTEELIVNNAYIRTPDIHACNGTIHELADVLR